VRDPHLRHTCVKLTDHVSSIERVVHKKRQSHMSTRSSRQGLWCPVWTGPGNARRG
jgi:hypothetical protein